MMASIQVIPHSFVRVEASVAFTPGRITFEAIPRVPMIIPVTKTAKAFDEWHFVDATEMLNNFS